MSTVTYSSNNSGGYWWLKDDDWLALEAAGWKVDWVADNPRFGTGDRWLGALAMRATREGLTLRESVEEWEEITGQNAADQGCNCCGSPHDFYDERGNSPSVASAFWIDWEE